MKKVDIFANRAISLQEKANSYRQLLFKMQEDASALKKKLLKVDQACDIIKSEQWRDHFFTIADFNSQRKELIDDMQLEINLLNGTDDTSVLAANIENQKLGIQALQLERLVELQKIKCQRLDKLLAQCEKRFDKKYDKKVTLNKNYPGLIQNEVQQLKNVELIQRLIQIFEQCKQRSILPSQQEIKLLQMGSFNELLQRYGNYLKNQTSTLHFLEKQAEQKYIQYIRLIKESEKNQKACDKRCKPHGDTEQNQLQRQYQAMTTKIQNIRLRIEEEIKDEQYYRLNHQKIAREEAIKKVKSLQTEKMKEIIERKQMIRYMLTLQLDSSQETQTTINQLLKEFEQVQKKEIQEQQNIHNN